MIYIAFTKCENTPASQSEAGVSARNKLFELFNIADEPKKTELGKPFVSDSRYHFSISHRETVAVCALRCKNENYDLPDDIFTIFEDGEGEIGIDIELFPSDDNLQKFNKIAKRYFDRVFESSEEFIYHWTKTEALCKYKGNILADNFKTDLSDKNFFCGTVEIENNKYILSVCY